MKRDDCIREMEALHSKAEAEQRVFTDDEAARFAELKVLATCLEQPMEDDVIEQPKGRTTPVAAAARSLSAAAVADGLVARMVANGRARVDVPVDIRMLARAFGSDQALNPAPGYAVQPQNLGPISTYHPIVNRLLSALASIPVTSNAVTYTRVTYKPDIGSPSPGTGNKAAVVQELAAKPQSELDTEEVTQAIETYAHWLPCSKQVLDDVSGLRALIDTTLTAGLLDKLDGIVMAAMTLAGRFTPYTPTGGDKIGDGIARVATALLTAGATGVKVALNPATILAMSIAKTAGSGEYQGMPANMPGSMVSSASVPVGKVLAWADTGAVWANREGVSVVAGLNADDFTRNRVSLLAETRGAVLTLDAQHVLFGSVTA